MRIAEIILRLEDIADRILSKDEQSLLIDLARKQKSAGIVIDNWELFIRRGGKDASEFIESMDDDNVFPDMPWEVK